MPNITEFEAENFKVLRQVRLPLDKPVTELTGPNGAGKSSSLQALSVLIDGLAAAPAQFIRNGQTKCRLSGRFGDLLVTRNFRKRKGGDIVHEIIFENADGEKQTATQKQLDAIIGERHMDPTDFINLKPRDQFDVLSRFVKGIDFAKIAREQDADFLRRADVNRQAKESEAAAHQITVPKGTPAEEVSIDALSAELEAAIKHNVIIDGRSKRRAEAEGKIKTLRNEAQTVAALLTDFTARATQETARVVSDVDAQVASLREQIKLIEQQIVAAQERSAQSERDLDTRIQQETERVNREAQAKTAEADALEKQLAAAGELPQAKDVEAIRKGMREAEETNRSVRLAADKARHLSTAKKYQEESEQITERRQAREAAKQKAIAEAGLPTVGLEFGDGELRLNGAPFSEASTGQKMRLAVDLVVLKNPGLPLIWIRDAVLIDDEGLAELNRLAGERGIKVILETVRRIGKDAIVLKDGEEVEADVRGAEAAA